MTGPGTGAERAEPPVASAADVAAIEAAGWPDGLPATTYDVFLRSAERFGDATALSFFLSVEDHRRTQDWSYRALLAEVTRAANLFTRLGVGPEDVVAYVLPNLPETHFALWGAEAAGRALAINPLLDEGTIAELLRAAGAKVLVTLAPFPTTDIPAKAMAAAAAAGVADVVLVDLADRVRGWKRVPAKLMALRAARRAPAPGSLRVHRWRRLAAAAPADRLLRGAPPRADDVASLFPTGGTTGAPKIAVRTHSNEVADAWMGTRVIGDAATPGDTAFCGLPLFHVNATVVTGIAAFLRGARVLLATPQGFRAPGLVDRFWEIVEHHRVGYFSGVPTLFAALLARPTGGRDLSSLRYCYCGAAPMPADSIRAFEKLSGARLLEGYGLTEGTCASAVNPYGGERRPGSVGLRFPFGELRPVVLDGSGAWLRDAAVGEPGAVAIAGPHVFRGYLDPAAERGLWLDRGDGRRWFNTGDLGRLDAEGYLWLTGRAKDIIIRGGHNIDPATIEEALHRHPAVELAAAVGRPDRYAGELPVVYVQLHDGAAAAEDELLAFAEAEVGERAARPKAVRVLDRLPQTAVSKIFKPALREMETRRYAEEALAEAGIAATVRAAVDPKRGMVVTVEGAGGRGEAARAALGGIAVAVDVAPP
ncbi:acyl-CoA synthetase [Lichenibacterium dinghuense]|uniref:acyl-CoA synthetase n=1 Tax=Lichenibacterium dinghuense TaxID=2895977 RepID=UPI001F2E43C3|nr:acyl-CoA synthetase [Lichenibacterium sp. 6Y81]